MFKITLILYYLIVSIQCLNLCGDWTQYKDKKCFKVLNRTATQAEALQTCVELNEKSSLVTIYDEEEQVFINELLVQFNNISINAWIGMKFNGHEYDWMDGTDSNFTNWSEEAIRDGREPCVRMSLLNTTLGKWTDSSCKRPALIVCQKKQELSLNSMKDIIEDMIKTIDKQNIDFKVETKELIEEIYVRHENQINSLNGLIVNQRLIIDEQINDFNTKTKEFENKINSLTEVIENQRKLSEEQTNDLKLENRNLKNKINSMFATKGIENRINSLTEVIQNQQNVINVLKISIEPPYFEQDYYNAEVYENQDTHKTIITITAKNGLEKCSCSKIRYKIVQGNQDGAFGVNNVTGAIYVALPLDYETKKEYVLTLVAYDNYGQDQTKVKILVKDINDLPPKFDLGTYETDIFIGDPLGIPRVILKVRATDGDVDHPQQIYYSLPGQVIYNYDYGVIQFSINSTTGEIYILHPLEKAVCPQWRFIVYAIEPDDDGLVGSAEVIINVKDKDDILVD